MTTQTLQIIDRKVIDRVEFHFPELMGENAGAEIVDEYYKLIAIEEELSNTRVKVRELENKLKEAKAEFAKKEAMFTLHFKTNTKEYTTNEMHVAIKGDSVRII